METSASDLAVKGPFAYRAGQIWSLRYSQEAHYYVLIARGVTEADGTIQHYPTPAIAILHAATGRVVLDGLCPAPPEDEIPSVAQNAMLDRLSRMSLQEFAAFCFGSSGFRGTAHAPELIEPSRQKKKGVVRRFAGWWLKGWWDPVRQLYGPETRAIGENVKLLTKQIKEDTAGWATRHDRRPLRTYDEMLVAWGINPDEVPYVLRMLRVARWKVIGITVLAWTALVWQIVLDGGARSWGYIILVGLSAVALGICVLVMTWRLHCLRAGRYEEFFVWLGFRRPTSRH